MVGKKKRKKKKKKKKLRWREEGGKETVNKLKHLIFPFTACLPKQRS